MRVVLTLFIHKDAQKLFIRSIFILNENCNFEAKAYEILILGLF